MNYNRDPRLLGAAGERLAPPELLLVIGATSLSSSQEAPPVRLDSEPQACAAGRTHGFQSAKLGDRPIVVRYSTELYGQPL